jgi:hypothetical protein
MAESSRNKKMAESSRNKKMAEFPENEKEYAFEISNTKADWRSEERRLIRSFFQYAKENDETRPISFRILINHDYSYEESDQNNLAYFFIFCDRLVQILEASGWAPKKIKAVTVHLYISSAKTDFHPAHYLMYLLSNIGKEKLSLYFYSKDTYPNSISDWGKILFPNGHPIVLGHITPLIRVKKDECRSLMMSPPKLNVAVKEMMSGINGKNNNKDSRKNAMREALSKALSGGEARTAYQVPGTPRGILQYIFLSNIGQALVDNKLHLWRIKPHELYSCFSKFVEDQISGHALLTQTIWSLIVRFAIELGDRNPELKGLTPGALENFLQKTLFNAQAYAEGIYQLIENSTLYSEGRCAYLSLSFNDVDPNLSIRSRAVKAAQYRSRIENKYSVKNGNQTPFKYQLAENTPYCLEIHIVDDGIKICRDADGKLGVENNGILVQSIRRGSDGIALLSEAFRPKRESIEDMIHHYGLPIFMRTVLLNGGVFAVSTPAYNASESTPDNYIASLNDGGLKELEKFENDAQRMVTEYEIALPVRFRDKEMPSTLKHLDKRKGLYMPDALEADIHKRFVNADEAKHTVVALAKNTDKLQEIERNAPVFYRKYFSPAVQTAAGEAGASNKDILLFSAFLENGFQGDEKMYHLHVEIFAKFLMYAIASFKKEREKEHSGATMLFALWFREFHFMYEFIRIFSIFYDFSGENDYLDNVQIALLHKDDKGGSGSDVNLILTGEKLSTARDTARLFAYFNANESLNMIPAIDYLSEIRLEGLVDDGNDAKTPLPPLFPFELYLKEDDSSPPHPEGENGGPDYSLHTYSPPPRDMFYKIESLFYNKVIRELNTDLRDKAEKTGYKIENTLVRLGSKIYIDTFYQAELLLQNVGNIYRFAFILAEYYMKELCGAGPKEHLLLVGYEHYSEILLQETKRLLNAKQGEGFCRYCIVPGNRKKKIQFPDRECVANEWDETDVLLMIPIGTTLTTFYAVKNHILQSFQSSSIEFKIDNAFVFLWVTYETYETDKTETKKAKSLKNRYFKRLLPDKKKVELHSDNGGQGGRTANVAFYLKANTRWFDPLEAPGDGTAVRRRALVGVDDTSLLPDAIFMRSGQRIPTFEADKMETEEREKRLAYLKGNFLYGHVAKGKNHFQFYINAQKMFLNDGMREHVENVAGEWRKKIDPYAFNILISPLAEKNSDFVKTVIDRTFDNSILFIHIANILNEYRDCIRTKYRAAIDECKRIKSQYRPQRINVYYIDNSITTGQNIRRARDMAIMILKQSGIDLKADEIFKGVFLLFNRSSFETLNPIVSDPDNMLFSFIGLRLPSFNMDCGECPTCRLRDLNENMERQSSTRDVLEIYHRLKIKHGRKDDEHIYEKWEYKAILEQGNYFEWLRHWMSQHSEAAISRGEILGDGLKEKANMLEEFFDALDGDDNDDNDDNNVYNIETAVKCVMKKMAVGGRWKGMDEAEVKETIAQHFFQREILSDRNYQRLICIDEAWTKLYGIPGECGTYKEYHYFTFKAIVDMIVGRFKLCIKTAEKGKSKEEISAIRQDLKQHFISQNDEWLRSYIKVISRRSLADYDHIKQAIFSFMRWLLAETVLIALNYKDAEEKASIRKEIAGVASGAARPDGNDEEVTRAHYEDVARGLYPGELPKSGLTWPDGCNKEVAHGLLPGELPKSGLTADMKAIISNVKKLTPNERYALVVLLLRRLADMKHSSIISYDFVRILMDYRAKEEEAHNAKANADAVYKKYNSFQKETKFVADYARLCKWIHVSDDDFNKAFAINKLIEDLRKDSCPEGPETEASPRNKGSFKAEMLQTLMLENTQPIYVGLSSLMRTKVEEKLGKPFEEWSTEDLIDKKYAELWDEIARGLRDSVLTKSFNNSGNAPPDDWPWRYHNMHMPIFRFLCDSVHKFDPDGKTGGADVLNRVTADIAIMLRYFCLVRQFKLYAADSKEHLDETLYPRLFTKICECIRDIAQFEECYIVLDRSEDAKVDILASSPICVKPTNRMDKVLTEQDILDLLERKKAKLENGKMEGIFLLDGEDGRLQTLWLEVFDLDIEHQGANGEEPRLFNEGTIRIVLARDRGADLPDDIQKDTSLQMRIRNILFLRASLASLADHCRYVLIDLKRRYDHIRKISDKDGVRVLHLSDLHIDAEKNYAGINEFLANHPRAFHGTCNDMADLLVITGDVIKGRGSAAEVQKNYESAEEIVKKIAEIVFQYPEPGTKAGNTGQPETGTKVGNTGQPETGTKARNTGQPEKHYLPPDWQKRIVIVTGNHDYASMNELKTYTGGRMTTVGGPASDVGGTMAKFAYFTDFLWRTLHVNTGELIEDDMNFHRRYESLGINVLALNSSSLANPRQNNKVGFGDAANKKFKKNLTVGSDKNTHMLICVHHSPLYIADYNRDHYYYNSGINNKISKKAPSAKIGTTGVSVLEKAMREFCDFVRLHWKNGRIEEPKSPKKFTEGIAKLKDALSEYSDASLYKDICFFLDHYEDYSGNERFHDMCDRICRLESISGEDNKAYDEFINELLTNNNINKTGPSAALIIGGHQHKPCWDEYKIGGSTSGCRIPVHECAGLYCKEEKKNGKEEKKPADLLHYSIIRLNADVEADAGWKVEHCTYRYGPDETQSARSVKKAKSAKKMKKIKKTKRTKYVKIVEIEKGTSPCSYHLTYKKRFPE